MRAIIPVAGIGSRLKPHTHTTPKVLLNVGGKPILGHILDKLLAEGITRATFIWGHLGDMIQDYVSRNYPQIDAAFVEQRIPEGLGHAIYTAAPTFDDEELFIILGDTIFDVNLRNVFSLQTSALGVKSVEDPRRFGVALMNSGKIYKLVEKPQEPVSNLALVGLYYIKNPKLLAECLHNLIVNNIRTRGEFQLTDALMMMIERGEPMGAFAVEGWYDCGKPETLLETNRFLLSQNKKTYSLPGVVINEPVYISDSAMVTNSVIGPYVSIGDGVTIADSIVKNSIAADNAEIRSSILTDSLIGSNSSIKGRYRRLNSGDSTEIDFN